MIVVVHAVAVVLNFYFESAIFNRWLPFLSMCAVCLFLLFAPYVSNVAMRSVWNQCNIKDRPTDDRPTTDQRPTSVPGS